MSNLQIAVDPNREVLIYGDGEGQAHVISSRLWTPVLLDVVQRKVLAARLRAIAELIEETS